MKIEPTEASALGEDPFPMPEMDANGLDRSQIRNHLRLTPFERLKAVESFLASTVSIRRGHVEPQYHQILFRLADEGVDFVGVGIVSDKAVAHPSVS